MSYLPFLKCSQITVMINFKNVIEYFESLVEHIYKTFSCHPFVTIVFMWELLGLLDDMLNIIGNYPITFLLLTKNIWKRWHYFGVTIFWGKIF